MYIKYLVSLDKQIKRDKKYAKRIFDTKENMQIWMKEQIDWIIVKFKYDYTPEEVQSILELIRLN